LRHAAQSLGRDIAWQHGMAAEKNMAAGNPSAGADGGQDPG
jgi:hypothetical protein